MTGKRMEMDLIIFTTHSTAREMIWKKVKRWTRLIGTWRRYMWSGWYFLGMKMRARRSTNWKKNNICDKAFPVYRYQNSTVDVEKKYVCRKVCCKCIKDIITCLNTCIPLRAATPINKKTPYRTGIGITWKQTELGQLIYSLTQCRT